MTIKKIVNRLLRPTNFELSPKNLVPESKIDAATLVMAYFVAAREKVSLVQIGACDGKTGDPITQFVKLEKVMAVLVEPIPNSFLELNETYEGYPNIEFCNAAIAEENGKVDIFTAKELRDAEGRHLAQVSSFDKGHLIKHGIKAEEIVPIKVEAFTLTGLIERYNLGQVDLLQIDAEGYDNEIVKMAFALPQKPACISYEYLHLSQEDQIEVLNQAAGHGYQWIHDRWNTLLVSEELGEIFGRH